LEPAAGAGAGRRVFLAVTVTAFAPPRSGNVQAIVRAGTSDTLAEIGRFGIFPSKAFDQSNPTAARRFQFEVPDCTDAGRSCTVRVEIELKVEGGSADGVRLGFDEAQLVRR
jgi:hypothetical protein